MPARARTAGARTAAVWARAGWIVVILCAAYLVSTTRTVAMAHNADSLIPVFVSLESWSLFYWGQDRFGMLLPLLARPIHDSFANLLTQNILGIALLLAGLAGACARLGLRAPVVWAIAIVAPFVTPTIGTHLVKLTLLTTNQSYAPAVGLFGLSMYVWRPRLLPGLAMVALALLGAWTNGGVALLAVLVALALALVREARPIAAPMLAGAVLSVAGHRVLQTWAATRITVLQQPALRDVPDLVWNFWADCYAMAGGRFWLVVLSLWAIAIARTCRRGGQAGDRRPSTECRCLLAIALAMFAYGTFMAIAFQGLGRHFVAALPLVVAAPLVVLARTETRFAALIASRAGMVAVATWLVAVTGVHHPAQVRRDLIASLGNGYEVPFYARGVTVVTGNYWDVWPAVFATNLLHERHSGRRPVLAVTLRSEPLRARLLAHLRQHAVIAEVPARHLDYWHRQPDLPPLRESLVFDRYVLAVVAP